MVDTKAGIRFSRDSYVSVDADAPAPVCNTGSVSLDMRSFPKQMHSGDTYQINIEPSEGCIVGYESSAPASKISIDENGLMTCIGKTTGFCGIEIWCGDPDGFTILHLKTKVEVI